MSMLILTRRVAETIVITLPSGETVSVTVLGVKGNQVRIGTAAPKHIGIHRQEIHERIQRGEPSPKAVANG